MKINEILENNVVDFSSFKRPTIPHGQELNHISKLLSNAKKTGNSIPVNVGSSAENSLQYDKEANAWIDKHGEQFNTEELFDAMWIGKDRKSIWFDY